MPITKRVSAEFIGTLWLVLGGCGTAVLADSQAGNVGIALAFGLTVLLGLQGLIHMGVVMGLMPTKGLVLPFISYGGSAMVINLTEAGILLGLSRRRV